MELRVILLKIQQYMRMWLCYSSYSSCQHQHTGGLRCAAGLDVQKKIVKSELRYRWIIGWKHDLIPTLQWCLYNFSSETLISIADAHKNRCKRCKYMLIGFISFVVPIEREPRRGSIDEVEKMDLWNVLQKFHVFKWCFISFVQKNIPSMILFHFKTDGAYSFIYICTLMSSELNKYIWT